MSIACRILKEMSQKQIKQESPGMRAAKGGGSKKNDKNTNNKPEVDSKFKENVVRKLYDSFQDSFSLEQISAVAHTCQWDCKYFIIIG